ncbi:unnamed protein product [Amoebophrya sp. A25]|nr:unnamed protein product [Amoebophrya sp. A25]|eukprot:GSA25T00021509001.1
MSGEANVDADLARLYKELPSSVQDDIRKRVDAHGGGSESERFFFYKTAVETEYKKFRASASAGGHTGKLAGAGASSMGGSTLASYVARVRASAENPTSAVGESLLDSYLTKLQEHFASEASKRDWTRVDLPSEQEMRDRVFPKLTDASLMNKGPFDRGEATPGRNGASNGMSQSVMNPAVSAKSVAPAPPAGMTPGVAGAGAAGQHGMWGAGGWGGGQGAPGMMGYNPAMMQQQNMMMNQMSPQMIMQYYQQMMYSGQMTPQMAAHYQQQMLYAQQQQAMQQRRHQQQARMNQAASGGVASIHAQRAAAMAAQNMVGAGSATSSSTPGAATGANATTPAQQSPFDATTPWPTAQKTGPPPAAGGDASSFAGASANATSSKTPGGNHLRPFGVLGAGGGFSMSGPKYGKAGPPVFPTGGGSGMMRQFVAGGQLSTSSTSATLGATGITSTLVPAGSMGTAGSSTSFDQKRRRRSRSPRGGRRSSFDSRSGSRSRGGRSRSRSRRRGNRRRSSRSRSRERGGEDGTGAWNKWSAAAGAKRGAMPESTPQPKDRNTTEWRDWLRSEFQWVIGEYGGPGVPNVASDAMQHFAREYKVPAKKVKDALGIPPGRYVSQIRLKLQGRANFIDGTLSLAQVMPEAGGDGGAAATWADDPNMKAKKKERENRFKDLSSGYSYRSQDWGQNWDDDDDLPFRANLDSEKPLVGLLDAMCSDAEITDRENTRQLDRFEISTKSKSNGVQLTTNMGTSYNTPALLQNAAAPVANKAFCVKKYQRSSADKQYQAKDIRTLQACWRSVVYLFTDIIDLDTKVPQGKYIFTDPVRYIQIYSFIRDRIRAVRVDLHVQQPLSTTTEPYMKTHEAAFRFELLSNFLAKANYVAEQTDVNSTEKYDERMAMRAISQTIEPLLHAYRMAREKRLEPTRTKERLKDLAAGSTALPGTAGDNQAAYISEAETSILRYVILMQLGESERVLSQLQKMEGELLKDPRIVEVLDLFSAYQSGDFAEFFKFYKRCDFLSAVCLAPLVDVMRYKRLVCMVRACHGSLGDQIPLESLMESLCLTDSYRAQEYFEFCGFKVQEKGERGLVVVVPKRPELSAYRSVDSGDLSSTTDASSSSRLQLLNLNGKAYYTTKAEISAAMKPFYMAFGARDSLLIQKYRDTKHTRAQIIFGEADISKHDCVALQNTPRGITASVLNGAGPPVRRLSGNVPPAGARRSLRVARGRATSPTPVSTPSSDQ